MKKTVRVAAALLALILCLACAACGGAAETSVGSPSPAPAEASEEVHEPQQTEEAPEAQQTEEAPSFPGLKTQNLLYFTVKRGMCQTWIWRQTNGSRAGFSAVLPGDCRSGT